MAKRQTFNAANGISRLQIHQIKMQLKYSVLQLVGPDMNNESGWS